MTTDRPSVRYQLDRERAFEWSDASTRRFRTLPSQPPSPYVQLVWLLWCALSEEDAPDFPTPESVALHVPPERAVEVAEKIILAVVPTARCWARVGARASAKPQPVS